MNEEIPVPSLEFIEENKLCKVVQKKHAPYSKKNRMLRRKEVYRLHFELGYPAVQISEMMKIHRNTINNDIKFLYFQLYAEHNNISYQEFMGKHFARFESQRTRLMEYLSLHNNDFEKRLSIERLILEVETRLISFTEKGFLNDYYINKTAISFANKILERKKFESRYYSSWELMDIPEIKRKAIDEILHKDKVASK